MLEHARHEAEAIVVGPQRAKWMLLTGRRVAAAEAEAWGLLDVLSEDAEAQAKALAIELAGAAPLAIAGMKQIFAGGEGDFREARRAAFNSADAKEGRDAFMQRRAPKFRIHRPACCGCGRTEIACSTPRSVIEAASS